MQIEGKKYICDRCKLESFAVKKETFVLDGGYTREPIFEIAEGWTRQNRGSEWRDLCPTCSEKLQRVIDEFWEKTEDEDGEINNKIGEYENTGLTPEQIMELKERDTAKKMLPVTYKPLLEAGWRYECPNCGCAVGENIYHPDVTKDYEYCSMCGQKLEG